jgi:hypothetical protein
MTFFGSKIGSIAATVALATAGVCATVAQADPLLINVEVNGNNAFGQYSQNGTPLGGGMFNYQADGFFLNPFWNLGYDLNAGQTATQALLSGNITWTNNTLASQDVTVTFILPISAMGPSTLLGGSVAPGLTGDAGGGTLATFGGQALWTALADGGTAASLFTDPTLITVDPFQSANEPAEAFGVPIPSLAFGAINDSIGIELNFTVGAGDQVSFTSVFLAQVVPAPAGLAALALGLVGRRNRRRA